MSCVVFGASGLIGRYLLSRLVERGVGVVAISRQIRAGVAGVQWLRGGLPDAVTPLPAADAVVCLGPLDHFTRWIEQAELPNAPRVVAMSSMSAESKRDSPVAAERELAARLRDSEQRLLSHCDARGSACTILRATLIYGGPEGSLERLAARARRWRVFPLPRGKGLRQPVHAEDLALAVLAALQSTGATGVIEAGGGERLSVTTMYERARRRWATHAVGVPLPAAMCRLLARSGSRGMVARLDADLVADNTRLHTSLGVQPRGMSDVTGRSVP